MTGATVRPEAHMDDATDGPDGIDGTTGYFNTRAAMHGYWRQYVSGARLFDPPYLVAPDRTDSLADLPAPATSAPEPVCGNLRELLDFAWCEPK